MMLYSGKNEREITNTFIVSIYYFLPHVICPLYKWLQSNQSINPINFFYGFKVNIVTHHFVRNYLVPLATQVQ